MTVLAARRKAEALVQRFGFENPPVDVLDVADKLGIRVVRAELGDDISGLLITRGDEVTICVEAAHSEVRRRFTIAHEIAHFWLGHQFEPGEHVHVDRGALVSMRSRRSAEGTDLREVEANQFAACLLMPRKMVQEAVRAHGWVLSELVIAELAKKFKVSAQAMTIRLSTLGYQ